MGRVGSVVIWGILLTLILGAVGNRGEAAAPRPAARRPGELIVAFRPGAAPAPERLSPSQTRDPRERLAFFPATQLATPNRPESLKRLDLRFGLRAGRALGVPAEAARPNSRAARPAAPGAPASNTAPAEPWLLRLAPAADLDQALAAYRADPAVLYAEPNFEGALAYVPSDPLYPQTRADFSRIGLETAWNTQRGANAGVVVAVIDSGIDASHPDLKAAVDQANSYNFTEQNTRVYDDLGHGTRVAGIIGATANNGLGIAGAAFGCELLSLDVATSAGLLTVADTVAAVNWAVAHGAGVINMSLSFKAWSQSLEAACLAASNAGVVLVAAAGNENQGEQPVYPAALNTVLGVGAIGDTARRAPWSNYNGTCRTLVDLVAPGETVFSTIPNGQYNGTYGSGTSFAAPMVSGVAALLKARYPQQSGVAIAHHLLATAAPAGAAFTPADGAGAGVLSAAKALATAMRPELAVERVLVDDYQPYAAANNGDGSPDAGETVRLVVRLRNNGADASGVTAVLSTTDGTIKIGGATATWGALGTSQVLEPLNGFTTVTVASTAPAHLVNFTLKVTSRYNGSAQYTQTFTFPLYTGNTHNLFANSYFTPQTWTADSTYYVQGTQNFNAGLTIQPGTVVRVAPGVDLNVNGGALKAEGTPDNPILLTAYRLSPKSGPAFSAGPHTEAVNLAQYAQVRYVSAARGSDATGTGSSAKPWATVDYALSKITAGSANRCALLVAEGTYHGNYDLKDGIDLYGGFEPQGWSRDIVAHQTVLDGDQKDCVVKTGNDTRLDGFHVIHAQNANDMVDNGAVNCYRGSPSITNNTIRNNASARICAISGGYGVSPVIANNLITENTGLGSFGHKAVYFVSCDPKLTGNIITNNTTANALELDACHADVEQNIVAGNKDAVTMVSCFTTNTLANNLIAYNGLGVMIGSSWVDVKNNFIFHNTQAVWLQVSSYLALTNNTIVQNETSPAIRADQYAAYVSLLLRNNISSNTGTELDASGVNVTMENCLIKGGYAGGSGVIDADPRVVGSLGGGVISQVQFDGAAYLSRLTLSAGNLPANDFAGKVIKIGAKAYLILSNTASTITVLGDATQAGSLPLSWSVFDPHLLPDSPCIDAGRNSGVATQDIDGEGRILRGRASATCDIGADEFNPAAPTIAGGAWGRLNLKNTTSGSSLRYCTFEYGGGVLNQSASRSISNCIFQSNFGPGLESTAGTAAITSCTAANNLAEGFKTPGHTLLNCLASANGSTGLAGGTLTWCRSENNVGSGLSADNATSCTALQNGISGIIVTGTATRCHAEGNLAHGILGAAKNSEAVLNKGTGIVGSADACLAFGNGGGGISGNAVNCQVIANTGAGVTGSATLSGCEIRDNTGPAASGVTTVNACRISNNGSGLSVGAAISDSYVAANAGTGVSGGTITRCTVVGNAGAGLKSPAAVHYSWVMLNAGIGIDAPLGDIDYSSVCANGGYGIQSPAGGKRVHDCNLYDNNAFDVYDAQNNAASGYPGNTKDFRYNYWGSAMTAQFTSHPFPSINMARIYDLFDTNTSKGWYINYGGTGELAAAPLTGSPGDKAPAFLYAVAPNIGEPLNVGVASFRLIFSHAMNTAKPLSVTFGLKAPYTTYVVAPAPGWIDAWTWQGSFAVQSDTANGLHTLRVAGATDTGGFVIPDDTAHTFVVETKSALSANNGLAIGQGTKMAVSWSEAGKPATALGYNIQRSPSGLPGSYVQLNSAPLTQPGYVDTGLTPNTIYFYMIYLVDSGMNAVQWTPPFIGNSGVFRNAAHGWERYR